MGFRVALKEACVAILFSSTAIFCANKPTPSIVPIGDDSFEIHINNTRVGFADFTHEGNVMTIDMINVLPNQRNQGFGRLLFRRMLDEADKRHVRIVRLDAKPLSKTLTPQKLADWYETMFREWEQEHLSRGGPHLTIRRSNPSPHSIKLTANFDYRF